MQNVPRGFAVLVIGSVLVSCQNTKTGVLAGESGFRSVTKEIGKWEVSLSTDKMDGTKHAILTLDAERDVQGTPFGGRPYLAIQCHNGKKLEVAVNTKTVLQHESGGYNDSHKVRLKLDKAPAITKWWDEGTDHQVVFSREAQGLVKQLTAARTLLFEFTPFQKSEQVAEFDLSGLASKLNTVAAVCGLKPIKLSPVVVIP